MKPVFDGNGLATVPGDMRCFYPYNAPTYQPLGRWDGIFHYIPPSF